MGLKNLLAVKDNGEKLADQIVRSVATTMFVVDPDLNIRFISDETLSTMGFQKGEALGMNCGELCKTPVCGTAECTLRRCMSSGETVIADTEATTRNGARIPITACCSAIKDDAGKVVGGIEVIFDQTDKVSALGQIRGLVEAAETGRLEERLDVNQASDEFKPLFQGVNRMLDAILDPIAEAVGVLEKLAQQDLTNRVLGNYQGDHARIQNSLNQALDNLEESLEQVSSSSDQVAAASEQISSGSQSMAQGASEQASGLEEVASSLQEIGASSSQSSANAKECHALSDQTQKSTEEGLKSMQSLQQAMQQIRESSHETGKIVKTIDEIAFQTNLLALNAAVEAARAGDAGKGFAVVAEEVRNLATRSAEAAKSTADMIRTATENAENGVQINDQVQAKLKEIAGQVDRVREGVAEIAAASEQQDDGLAQINKAIEQINQVTQQSAANAEESASAAEELSGQAEAMKSLVRRFEMRTEAQKNLMGHSLHTAGRRALSV